MRPEGLGMAATAAAMDQATMLRALLSSRPDSRLFRAEFQYLPLRDSPNENPHVELALQPGELLLVHGPMDEDKFYWGETLDGRAGLVPSNFVQRLSDVELREFAHPAGSAAATLPFQSSQSPACPAIASTSASALVFPASTSNSRPDHSEQQPLLTLVRPNSPSFVLAVPQHLAQISHDFSEQVDQQKALPDSVCPYPPADVSRVTVQEVRQPDQPKVPWPRELHVERRLSRSVLLSWLPPESTGLHQSVSQYQVCVNGQVRAVVPGSLKCRALLENLDLETFVNISVRAVGADGLASSDAACTLAVGAEAPVAPQHVRISQITPSSAQLSWLPSDSSAEHVVLLNALKVGVCPPAVFQVQLNGLSPSTIYRLSVRTKHPRAVLEKRPVERCVDLKTLPKIGLPDPPLEVQAEPGPQPGSLLLSWRPNSSQPRPPSRAAVHSYLVYADGRCIAQVPGSTADHVLLRLADFADDPPVFLTVRTRTKEGTISADSNVVRVPRSTAGEQFQSLLSSSLPSHLLGQLVSSNGTSLLSTAPKMANSPRQLPSRGQDQGLLLMTASRPSIANGPRWEAFSQPTTSRPFPEPQPPPPLQQHQQQQQYFTFHPKALDKELPRFDERPDVLAMEQNYLLRHQQRQRMRSATPERRSFPLAKPRMAAVLPGAPQAPARQFPMLPLPPQLARLRNDSGILAGVGSTRSEPDLRPNPVPRMERGWFVAIQDHQPGLAASEELPFRRHQLVKVHGEVDANGQFWGEVRGRCGLVPAGKLMEIAKEDLFLAAEQQRPMPAEGMGAAQPWGAVGPGPGPSTSLRRMRWSSIKSRSYEQVEGGQQRRQRAFLGSNSDQEGMAMGWQEGRPWAGHQEERRGSALEPGMGTGRGTGHPGMGTGYKLPAVNGPRSWRGEPAEEEGAEPDRNRHRAGAAEEMAEERLSTEEGPAQQQGDFLPQSSIRGALSQLMVAKYDYDSRQLSPNVDAEQVELSFRQGDMIAVYGPMDEDGFFLGELNGIRGLVPSNFLQPVDALPTSRPKGVAFSSDLANHTSALPWPPNSTAMPRSVARRSAQQPEVAGPAKQQQQQQGPSATARLTGATGMTSKAYKVSGIAPSAATKTLTKKSSDLSARALQQQSTSRKGSQAAGKGPPGAMKRKG